MALCSMITALRIENNNTCPLLRTFALSDTNRDGCRFLSVTQMEPLQVNTHTYFSQRLIVVPFNSSIILKKKMKTLVNR